MRGRRALLLAVTMGAVVAGPAVWAGWQRSRVVETMARSGLDLPDRGSVELRYRTAVWQAAKIARMRADAGFRGQQNPPLVLSLGIEFETDVALSCGDVAVDPGIHRLALRMDDAGAWELCVLQQREFVPVPFDLSSRSDSTRWLQFGLAPALDGDLELWMRWDHEFGRAVWRRRRP